MIATVPEAEVAEYVGRFVDDVDEGGRRLVVRNGRARERKLTVGSGTVAVRAPRVNDKRVDAHSGERQNGQEAHGSRTRAGLLGRGWSSPIRRRCSRANRRGSARSGGDRERTAPVTVGV
jgi:hypothetical protein